MALSLIYKLFISNVNICFDHDYLMLSPTHYNNVIFQFSISKDFLFFWCDCVDITPYSLTDTSHPNTLECFHRDPLLFPEKNNNVKKVCVLQCNRKVRKKIVDLSFFQSHPPSSFCGNLFHSFSVILLTSQPINKKTETAEKHDRLGGVNLAFSKLSRLCTNLATRTV